ncbi:hypothetical protein [uncultured Corynebacterium sp.]|uniref:hypothetical protein n=1 Tax=uncultured Corynebacterium sp. TaxID=159447 RepID=UPI0025F15DD6|nr:hypothetical protein [uncultured Corynebacterium sp.]
MAEEEDKGTAEKDTAAVYEADQRHSPVPRAISGIAIVGLALAGVIGVWTWQSGSEATSPKRSTAEESTVAISTGAASQDHDVVSDEPSPQPAPPAYSTRAPQSGDGSNFSNVAPLGQDPYLPPNAWNGQQNDGLQPSQTIIAEGLGSRGQTQQQVPTQSQSPQPIPQGSSALPGATQAQQPGTSQPGSTPGSTQPGTTQPGPTTETDKATDGSAAIPFPTDGFPLEPSDSTKTAEPQRETDGTKDPKDSNKSEASDGPTDTTAGPKPKPRDGR